MVSNAANAGDRGQGSRGGHPSFTVERAAAELTREGHSWSPGLGQGATVTYAFRSAAPDSIPGGASGFERLSSQQIGAVERALELWSRVADIRFVRVGEGSFGEAAYSDAATILFGGYTAGAEETSAFAILPGSTAAGAAAGDVWLNHDIGYMRYPGAQYDPGFLTLVHEIGHAIGLSHPGDYDANGGDPAYAADAGYAEDSLEYTVMSYFDLSDTGGAVSDPRWQPAGPLIDDIAAAQRLYGVNTQANSGDTVYGSNPYSGFLATAQGDRSGLFSGTNLPLWGTIWDGGGVDTLDFGGTSYAQTIDLRAGHFSNVQGGVGTLSIALGVTIENAVGGAVNDVITGNDAANRLFGNIGDDVLTGGRGDDLLDGGGGADRAVIAARFDATALQVAGTDVIAASADGRDTLRLVETIVFADRTLQTSVVTATDGVYREYMGRGAAASDLSYWVGRFDAGGTTGEVRAAILSDPTGRAHAAGVIDAIYVDRLGRSANAGDLGYWDAQLRNGTDFASVRAIVGADAGARAYAAAIIQQGYADYLDRAPSRGELGYWGDQFASGLARVEFRKALASDWASRPVVAEHIAEAYGFGLGRAALASEADYWTAQLRAGTTLRDMRAVIANATEAPASDAAVTAAYTTYMGRLPNAFELGYWNGQARAGAGHDEMRGAIIADPVGQAYNQAQVRTLYQEYFGRAPSGAELQIWLGLFADGATPGALLAALVTDPASVATSRYSAAAQNSVTALPADFEHVVVDAFRNFSWGPDPYAGASVPPPPDSDVLDLRNTPFAGLDPLAAGRARDIVDLSGGRGVLISYDADHDILLRGVQLWQLDADNFLF